MTHVLVRKLLRDVRVGLVIVAVLLAAFQCLWARVTANISGQILPFFSEHFSLEVMRQVLFRGPGQIIQTLMGGESIDPARALDMFSISYVHPLTQTILCVWAVGRAAGAIAGELDKGTMELLLAQPLRRGQVILAHLTVDAVTIPVLCLSLWGGTWLGTWLVGLQDNPQASLQVDPRRFGPALFYVAALLFAVSGYTMALSSAGRFRGRVLGIAVLATLVQFLINVIAQLWDAAGPFRWGTVFAYFQPQPMILTANWAERAETWRNLLVLLGVGTAGYLLAWQIFRRRDLPAPL